MKKLVWRLGKLPSVEELLELVKDKIITQEEAKEVLFSSEIAIDRDKKSLEEEVKFLRELVVKLSQNNRTTIVETIREVERPWRNYSWYGPYDTWCGGINTNVSTVKGVQYLANNATSFSELKTF